MRRNTSRSAVGAMVCAFVLSVVIARPAAADGPNDGNDDCQSDHQAQGNEQGDQGDGCALKTFTIVSSLPLSWAVGDTPVITQRIVNAIQMALSDAGNRAGRVRIAYRSLDDLGPANGWAGEIANANQAAADPSVLAYIGPFNSTAAVKSIPILCAAGLAMVSPTNTRDGLTKAAAIDLPGEPGIYYPNGCARNYSRTVPRNSIDGELAAIRMQALGGTSAFVVQTPTYNPFAFGFVSRASLIGLPIVANETISGQGPSFADLGQRVAASGADFLLLSCVIGPDNCPQIVRDVRSAAPNVRIMATDVTVSLPNPSFLIQTGPAAEGVICVREFVSPHDYTGAAAAWHARYETLYGPETGDGFSATLYAYDATRAVLAAIRRAGPHPGRNSVRAALMSTTNFNGLLGSWSFDADGDTTQSIVSTMEVRGGVWVNTGTVTFP